MASPRNLTLSIPTDEWRRPALPTARLIKVSFSISNLATQSQLPYGEWHVDKTTSTPGAVIGAPLLLCQLSEVQPGLSVRIKQLSASPEMTKRLRELGFCEDQRIKLLSRNANLICQVCNARLGLSSQLADLIWVERIPPRRLAA